MDKAQIGTKHITPAGSNIFAELGFSPDEATKLKDRSDAIIAQKMNIKFALMQEIESWIEVEELKQKEAAQLLGCQLTHKMQLKCQEHQSLGTLLNTISCNHLPP